MAASCPPGYSADTIMYVPMPFGALNDPVSSNCYRNDAGVVAIAVTFIALFIVEFVVEILFLRLLTNRAMRRALMAHLVNCLIMIAFSICAIVKPEACFFLWSFASVFIYLWWFNIVSVLLEGVAGTIAKIDKASALKVSAGFNYRGFQLLCFFPSAAIWIGGLGASITRLHGKDDLTLIFWQLHCVGWIFSVNLGVFFWSYVCRNAATIMEDVNSNVRDNVENDRLTAVVKNFRKTSMYAFVMWPAGAGLWTLHAVVVPCFYYLAFMQVLNVLLSGAVATFFFTTSRQRAAVKNMLFCSHSDAAISSDTDDPTRVLSTNTEPGSASPSNGKTVGHSGIV